MTDSKIAHGDAWRYFSKECTKRGIKGAQFIEEVWPWFLAGWLAKAQQRNDLRKKQ